MFVANRNGPRYTKVEAERAILSSKSWAEALRRLGMRPAGGNHRTIQMWAARWQIGSAHFDPYTRMRERRRERELPLAEILVEHSRYSRGALKRRLYREGFKSPLCEMCGQGELWHGREMSLILDHINGVSHDNRLENLRIVCPELCRNSRHALRAQCPANPGVCRVSREL